MGGVVTFAGFRVPKRLRTIPWIVHLDVFVLLKKSVWQTRAVSGVWEEDLLEGVARPVDGCVPKGSWAGELVSATALYWVLHSSSPQGVRVGSEILSVLSGFVFPVLTSNVHFQHFLASTPVLTLPSLSGMSLSSPRTIHIFGIL